MNWGNVRGMTLASGKLIYALNDGRLYSVNWGGTKPTGAVTQISSATTWQSRGMFAFNQVTDTFAPSKPGTPTGSSSTFDSIDISWGASTDNFGSSLTYRVYRDGVQIDQVASSSTGTVSYTDIGLPAGSIHTYQVDAVDAATNASVLSDVSGQITVQAPDMTPPGDPGIPTGVSNSTSTIDLIWAAAVDNVSTDLTYRVFRDGQDAQHQIAQFTSAAGTLTYTDTGLWPGSSHTYYVEAVDEAGNEGNQVASAPITVTAAVFADDFSGGIIELEHGHQDHPGRLDRLVFSAQRPGESHEPDRVRLREPIDDADRRVRERQRECLEQDHSARSHPAPHGRERSGREGVPGCSGSADRSIGLRQHSALFGSDTADRVEPDRDLRHRCHHVRYMGSLSQRLPDRERVGGEHRHDTGRADSDRRHRGQDMDGELRRRDRG